MTRSILSRLEKLESKVRPNATKRKERFIDGIAESIRGCDMPIVKRDHLGRLLNGWHFVDHDAVLGITIVGYGES